MKDMRKQRQPEARSCDQTHLGEVNALTLVHPWTWHQQSNNTDEMLYTTDSWVKGWIWDPQTMRNDPNTCNKPWDSQPCWYTFLQFFFLKMYICILLLVWLLDTSSLRSWFWAWQISSRFPLSFLNWWFPYYQLTCLPSAFDLSSSHKSRVGNSLGLRCLEASLSGKEFTWDAGDSVSIPGSGRSSGGGNGTHSSILAWKIPWTEEPGRLQSIGLQKVSHDWTHMDLYMHAIIYTHTHLCIKLDTN